MNKPDFYAAPVEALLTLSVGQVVDLVYGFQNLAGRLAEDMDGAPVPLPPRSQRETLQPMAMQEIVSVVADLGAVGSLLPAADATEATLTICVRPGLEDAMRRFIHEAAAYALLSWILGGIHNPLSEKYRRLRELRLSMAKGVAARRRVALNKSYV